jgi:hypothetical protein
MNVCLHKADFSTETFLDVREVKHCMSRFSEDEVVLVNDEYDEERYTGVISITINV